ncbi:hypothetical protein TARUN_5596 [Trichoderma arundinaceum]|uniref:Uncharacterized protein n=1 Tax=Trichoderma arundinaceum TaxID=490622 RepID=A0A395NKP7_TRIAR|nr:hypothetical protein TARUN_5596 [Trichoderma arundinaceum]
MQGIKCNPNITRQPRGPKPGYIQALKARIGNDNNGLTLSPQQENHCKILANITRSLAALENRLSGRSEVLLSQELIENEESEDKAASFTHQPRIQPPMGIEDSHSNVAQDGHSYIQQPEFQATTSSNHYIDLDTDAQAETLLKITPLHTDDDNGHTRSEENIRTLPKAHILGYEAAPRDLGVDMVWDSAITIDFASATKDARAISQEPPSPLRLNKKMPKDFNDYGSTFNCPTMIISPDSGSLSQPHSDSSYACLTDFSMPSTTAEAPILSELVRADL